MGVDHPGLGMTMGELVRTIRRIARQTIQNASIGRAGIRVYDGGWIRIEDGGLQVTGTASVSGTLTGSGTFDWTGPMNLKGAQSITGPTTFTGQMTVNGPWALKGNGTIDGTVGITGPLNVLGVWNLTGNGEIKGNVSLTGELTAGNVKISPSTAGGQIGFGSGRQINAGSGFLGIYDGSRFIVFNSSGVAIHGGGATITVSANGVRMNLPKITKAGIPSGCVYVGGDGYLYEG